MDLISSRFRAEADLIIHVDERLLYDRFDHPFVQTAEPSCQMAEAHERVAADPAAGAGTELNADRFSELNIEIGKSERKRYELEFVRIISLDRVMHLLHRDLWEILKFHGSDGSVPFSSYLTGGDVIRQGARVWPSAGTSN